MHDKRGQNQMHNNKAALPYEGLKILDVSQGIAGPYCAHILWQQGAEVIKVEPPSGDWGRFVGVIKGPQSALSVQFNAGKRSLALDTSHEQGREVIAKLAMNADIIVQNFRPGVAKRMGLDYETWSVKKPDLVYVSISGYGQDGPYAFAPASDSVMQADTALMFTNQDEHGVPRRIGALVADVATGLYAAQASSAALYQRLARGVGTHVEVSLFEACAAFQGMQILEYAMVGKTPGGAVSAPNGVFDTADGKMTVLALNNDQFARLCKALGQEQWLSDERFADNASRMAHKQLINDEVNKVMKQRTNEAWMERLKQHEVLHAPVRDYEGLIHHPQSSHLNMFQSLMQPGVGPLPYAGLPTAPHRRPVSPAPVIGEHSTAILSEAGWDTGEISRLIASGIVKQGVSA